MAISATVLEELHTKSARHRSALGAAPRCGCFYCKRVFSPREITDWINDGIGETAICPHCGIDSVVPESPSQPLTPELMQAMHAYWFERTVTLPRSPAWWQALRMRLEPIFRRISWYWSNRAV